MELLVDVAAKKPVRSLWDDRLQRLPGFEVGSAEPLSVGVVDKIGLPFDARLFNPQDLTGVEFRAALGVGFLIPDGGKFNLTFEAEDTTTETTDDISYDPSSYEVSDLLNAGANMVAAGGVEVTGGDGFFRVTFNEVGARNLLTGDAGSLVPTSVLDIQRVVTGGSETREVQTIRIVQNAAAFATLSAPVAAAAIALTTVQAGGGGKNHQVRIAITGNVYLGTWLFSKASVQSGPIGYDDSAAEVQAILGAVVGTGNAIVVQEGNSQWLVTFVGGLANTDLTGAPLAVDGTNLYAIPKLSGVLDLSTAAAGMLLNGSESRVVAFEIEKVAGGTVQKILRQDVVLKRPVIEPAMTAPPVLPELFTSPIVLRGISTMDGTAAATDLGSIDIRQLSVGSGPYFFRLENGEFVAVYIDDGAATPGDPAECASVFTDAKHWTRGA